MSDEQVRGLGKTYPVVWQTYSAEELKGFDEAAKLAESLAAGGLWWTLSPKNETFKKLHEQDPSYIFNQQLTGARVTYARLLNNRGIANPDERKLINTELAYVTELLVPAIVANFPPREGLTPLNARFYPPDYEQQDINAALHQGRADLFENGTQFRSLHGAPPLVVGELHLQALQVRERVWSDELARLRGKLPTGFQGQNLCIAESENLSPEEAAVLSDYQLAEEQLADINKQRRVIFMDLRANSGKLQTPIEEPEKAPAPDSSEFPWHGEGAA